MSDNSKERDRILLRMLKTPPRQHGDSAKLAKLIEEDSLDIDEMAKLTGQSDSNSDFGKRQK
ncbi:MAG: hypothetical protein K2X60_06530 [Xanthobacteraceae bacterium]|nr:hypothetical protein [Xanthobacteraceae bacterium]